MGKSHASQYANFGSLPFVFKFISVPAKWGRTSRQYVLNIYSCNNAYADVFQNDFG